MVKKLYKPVLLIFVLCAAAITAVLSFLLWQQNVGIYLDASDYIESPESIEFRKKNQTTIINKNSIENSFLGYGYDNYSLYDYKYGEWSLTKKKVNGVERSVPDELKYQGINSSSFLGNINSYNDVTNDAMNVELWNNDFAVINLVIKTKNDFSSADKLNVKIGDDKLLKDNGLLVSDGFLRYIVANATNTNWNTLGGIQKDMIVPDGITADKTIKMYKNNVYVYRIRIDRKNDTNTSEKNVNLPVQIFNNGKLIDFKQIGVIKINKKVPGVNEFAPGQDATNKPSYNILDYPNNISYFYNNYGNNKNDLNYLDDENKTGARFRNEAGICPPALTDSNFNVNDRVKFVDWNWSHYWEPELKYQHDFLGSGSYFMAPFSHDGNHLNSWAIGEDDKYMMSNLWNDDRGGNSPFIMKIKDGKVFLTIDDWEPFDDYVSNVGSLGFRKLILSTLVMAQFWTSAYFVYDNETKTWNTELLSRDPNNITSTDKKGNPIGRNLLEQTLKVWADHIKYLKDTKNSSYTYNWIAKYPDMDASFYIDEPVPWEVPLIEDAIKKVDPSGELHNYMKTNVALSMTYMDKSGKWEKQIENVDTLYMFISMLYLNGNEQVKDVISKRNAKGLTTGMYQLSTSGNNDMLREEPGTLSYEMLLLNKQKEPNYMKYNISRWNSADNYWSAAFWEPEWYTHPNPSGDVVWEYPNINSVDDQGNRKAKEEIEKEFQKYWEPDGKIAIITSTRLEQLALGVNIVNKIQVLTADKKININDINELISIQLTGSWKQSANKFNFDRNKLDIKIKMSDLGISYINSYLIQKHSEYGEIDAVKNISFLIDSASESYLEVK